MQFRNCNRNLGDGGGDAQSVGPALRFAYVQPVSEQRTIEIVSGSGGDWVGVYVDGVVVRQTHSFSGRDMLELLEIPHTTVEVDQEWLEGEGWLPDLSADIPAEVKRA